MNITTTAEKLHVQKLDFYGRHAGEQTQQANTWRLAWQIAKLYDCGEGYKAALRRNMRDHALTAAKMARVQRAETNAFWAQHPRAA